MTGKALPCPSKIEERCSASAHAVPGPSGFLERCRRNCNVGRKHVGLEVATDPWTLSLYKENSTPQKTHQSLTSSSSSNPPFTIFLLLLFPFSLSFSLF